MGNSNSVNSIGNKSFGSISSTDNPRPGYYNGKGIVIYSGSQIKMLPGEDTKVQKLKHGYASTNMRVFYKGIPIKDADPSSFEVIEKKNLKSRLGNQVTSDQFKKLSNLNHVVAIDQRDGQKRVFIEGKLITP